MNSVNFQSRLRRNFSGSVNFQAVFSSDSVNVAGPLSKTATKSLSQPILFKKMQYAHSNTEYYTKALYFQKKSLNGKESASSSHTAQGEFDSSSA